MSSPPNVKMLLLFRNNQLLGVATASRCISIPPYSNTET